MGSVDSVVPRMSRQAEQGRVDVTIRLEGGPVESQIDPLTAGDQPEQLCADTTRGRRDRVLLTSGAKRMSCRVSPNPCSGGGESSVPEILSVPEGAVDPTARIVMALQPPFVLLPASFVIAPTEQSICKIPVQSGKSGRSRTPCSYR